VGGILAMSGAFVCPGLVLPDRTGRSHSCKKINRGGPTYFDKANIKSCDDTGISSASYIGHSQAKDTYLPISAHYKDQDDHLISLEHSHPYLPPGTLRYHSPSMRTALAYRSRVVLR